MQSPPETLPELVRTTCAWVAEQATHVTISDEGLANAAANCDKETIERIVLNKYDTDLHFVDGGHLTAQYLLILDAINFCFWPGRDLQQLVGWPKELPAQEERARLIREIGRGLSLHFEGSAAKLVQAANNSAAKLVELTTSHFPGFRDHTIYKGHQVHLYKRAQIWVADIWGAFNGKGLGLFQDIATLTMFADYRVPVTLTAMGILQYSKKLEAEIQSGIELPSGSEEETEIRACTVVAVERLKKRLCQMEGAEELNSVLIDWWLWEEGEKRRDDQQHHRTLTIYY